MSKEILRLKSPKMKEITIEYDYPETIEEVYSNSQYLKQFKTFVKETYGLDAEEVKNART